MFELGQRKFLLLRPFSGLGRHVCAGLVRQGTLSAAPTAAARRVGFPASGQYGRFPAGNYLTPLYAEGVSGANLKPNFEWPYLSKYWELGELFDGSGR